MPITCHARKTLPCAPPAAFALMLDPVRFPPTFTGYGPIPGILAITAATPPAVGATRRIDNTDGSTLTETITALDAPTRHAYTLEGFRAPFSWLVARGEADWSVAADGPASLVHWRYTFTPTGALVYPLALLLLRVFMARAMRRCLDNMAGVLATNAPLPAETI